jgi:hypothetical protein
MKISQVWTNQQINSFEIWGYNAVTSQSGVYARTSNEPTAFMFRADGDNRFIFYYG